MVTDIAKIEAFKPEQHSVEECLIEMSKYGNPRISRLKSGWYSKIEVFVTGEGVEFDVASEFKHDTPSAAINECYHRLMKSIQQIKETK